MDKLSGSSIVVAKESVYCNVEDEIVILGLKDGVYYGLNNSGAFIWDLIQKPRRITDITNMIVDEYDVEEKTCKRDLLILIQELLDKGLVEVEENPRFSEPQK